MGALLIPGAAGQLRVYGLPAARCSRTEEKRPMPSLEDAIALAVEAHRGQKDRSGEPYILHPLRVMLPPRCGRGG